MSNIRTPLRAAILPAFVLCLATLPAGVEAGSPEAGTGASKTILTLPPLAPGEHTLYLSGRFCPAGSFADRPGFGPADGGYRLNVVGAPSKSGDGADSDSDSDSDSDNVEIVESLYAAFSAGDLDTINAIIDEDVIWIESEGIPYGGTFIGRDAVFAGVFGKIAEDWDDFTATVDETFAAGGGRVIVRQRDGGTFKATGKSMEAPAISIWTLDDGRVVQFLQVIDTQEVVSATLP